MARLFHVCTVKPGVVMFRSRITATSLCRCALGQFAALPSEGRRSGNAEMSAIISSNPDFASLTMRLHAGRADLATLLSTLCCA